MEQREQKLNLLGLCRNIVQTRAESSLLGCAECSRYSTKLIVTEEDEVKLAWAMPWRELTTSREERLSLLRLSRGAKEEDESQLTTSREERLSLLRLSRGAKEEDEVKTKAKPTDMVISDSA